MAKIIYEPFFWQNLNPTPIIGVDEVGRGCLAGPVYAGAVILKSDEGVEHFTDSKLIAENRREELSELIYEKHMVGIGFASVEEIEQLNILWAAMLAMKRAVLNLQVNFGHILVDGNKKIPDLEGFIQTTIVKGDLRAAPISAASIVAKVARDQWLKKMAKDYPEYGFEIHKGYGTPEHKKRIKKFGPSKEHRRGFAGVREHI